MNNRESTISSADLENKTVWFIGLGRERGLKVTPQRIAIYRELVKTNEHPSAETLCEKVRQTFPSISLDTVNRTLLTLNNIGAAFIVEGSGDAKRFDGGLDEHQHFKCVKCKRVIDFSHEPFNNIEVPQEMEEMFVVLRKSVYLEGICDLCR